MFTLTFNHGYQDLSYTLDTQGLIIMSETTLYIAGMILVLVLILVLISNRSSAKNKHELLNAKLNVTIKQDHTEESVGQQTKLMSFKSEGVQGVGSVVLPKEQNKSVQVKEQKTKEYDVLKNSEANIAPLKKGVQEDKAEEPLITLEREIIHDKNSHRLPSVHTKVSIRKEPEELVKAEVKYLSPQTEHPVISANNTVELIMTKALLKSLKPDKYICIDVRGNIATIISSDGSILIDNWSYVGPQQNANQLLLIAQELSKKVIVYHEKHESMEPVLNTLLCTLRSVTSYPLSKVRGFSTSEQYKKIHQSYNEKGYITSLKTIMKLEGLTGWEATDTLSECKRINLLIPILHANGTPIYILNEDLGIKSKLSVSRMSNLLNADENTPVGLFWRDLGIINGQPLGMVSSAFGYELMDMMPDLKLVVKHEPKPHVLAFYPSPEELEVYEDFFYFHGDEPLKDPVILKIKKMLLLNEPQKKQITFNIAINSSHPIPDEINNLRFDEKNLREYSKDPVFRCHMFNEGKKLFSTRSSSKPFLSVLNSIDGNDYTLNILERTPTSLKVKFKVLTHEAT